MPENNSKNLAEIAAESADQIIFEKIDKGESFLLEAGAGAGKTYSLIKVLKYLIKKDGQRLLKNNQKIACITYTNVATDEIKSRTDGHPVILASTIHAFCWSLIKDFQPFLKEKISIYTNWQEKLAEAGGIGGRKIEYDLGYPRIKDGVIFLGHNDILNLTVELMEQTKFRQLFISRYPILLIDEYQDTDKKFANSLINHFIKNKEKILIGFFGDHWQKIYGEGCGKIDESALNMIGKRANFRSAPEIVNFLNKMRPQLTQEVSDPTMVGNVGIYHTNDWMGQRRSGGHWEGDLPPDAAGEYLDLLIKKLESEGWIFEPSKTKILMLTHRVLAERQGYDGFEEVFQYNDEYIKKENPFIAFFADILEPVCIAYKNKKYGEMFAALGERIPNIKRPEDKGIWIKSMDDLMNIRDSGTIGDVLDYLKKTNRPRLSETIIQRLRLIEKNQPNEDELEMIQKIVKLRNIPYKKMIALAKFIDEKTPFSTKHGVKGAEFENVLVVFGRGWNQYNFNQMLEWVERGIPQGKDETFERNRNLFYVACSRSKKRLALLFTQELSPSAISTLSNWFGRNTIHTIVR